MPNKSHLIGWARRLGIEDPDEMTVGGLQQAIDLALYGKPGAAEQVSGFTFAEGLANNLRVLRKEGPETAKAIARNLFG